MPSINIFDEIIDENNLFTNFINNFILEYGRDNFYKTIKNKLQISNNRSEFVIKILKREIKINEFLMNNILRCITKKLCESKDINFFDIFKVPKNNFLSKACLYEYDPAKNGQNILKHGLDFGEVISYAGNDYGRLISYTKSGDEERVVIFSKYYVNDKNNIFSIT